jgi:hypothetical protein
MMWVWIQKKYPMKYVSEREFLAVRASVNKLKAWNWYDSWLTFSGHIVDFGHKGYKTRAAISNVYAFLCLLERFRNTVSNEDLRVVFWEATKLMMPLSKDFKKRDVVGRTPDWILNKAAPTMVNWLATPMDDSVVYLKAAKDSARPPKKSKQSKATKPPQPNPKRAAASAAKLAAGTTTTDILEDLSTCTITDGGVIRSVTWLG